MRNSNKKLISLVLIFTLLIAIFMPSMVNAGTGQLEGQKKETGGETTKYTVTFDINGGEIGNEKYPLVILTYDAETTFTLPSYPEMPELTLVENGSYITVYPPEGKTFDAYEVDGVRVDPEDSIKINSDTVIKYLWKDIVYIHEIKATIEAPIVGTIIDGEYDEEYDIYKVNSLTSHPKVTISEGANFKTDNVTNYWSIDDNDIYIGEIKKDTEYNAEVIFDNDEGYEFAEDTKVIINGEEVEAESNLGGYFVIVNYPIKSIEKNNNKEYIINSQNELCDASLTFTDKEGNVYEFIIFDLLSVTGEELQEVADSLNATGITFEDFKEEFNKYIAYGKNAANGKGDLLKFYDMDLYNNDDEIHEVEGGFTIKLKVTDDMKGYDSYKLIYIADDGTTEEAIELINNEGYLEGKLPHLSLYALVGSKTENNIIDNNTTGDDTTEEDTTAKTETVTETSNNPKTGDNIAIWSSIIVVSMIGIAGTVFSHTAKFQ